LIFLLALLCVGEHCALVNTALQDIGYTCCIRSGEVLQPNGVYANALGHRTVFVDLGAEGTYVLDVSAIHVCTYTFVLCLASLLVALLLCLHNVYTVNNLEM
jgi:hypothetical protein